MIDYEIGVSFVEIYNENLRELLATKKGQHLASGFTESRDFFVESESLGHKSVIFGFGETTINFTRSRAVV